jgi:hypothetical protein
LPMLIPLPKSLFISKALDWSFAAFGDSAAVQTDAKITIAIKKLITDVRGFACLDIIPYSNNVVENKAYFTTTMQID